MKKMKKCVSVLLFVLLLLSALPISAGATVLTIAATDYVGQPGPGPWDIYGETLCYGKGVTANYAVNVENAGTYHFTLLVSSANKTFLKGTVNGQEKEISFQGGGGYGEVYLGAYQLKAGKNTLALTMTDGGDTYFLREITAEKAMDRVNTDFSKKTGAFKNNYLPTKIEAEDFDLGAEGYDVKSNDVVKNSYRENSGVPIAETDGGYKITLKDGEWTQYTFRVVKTGSYDVSALVSGGSRINLYFDGSAGAISADAQEAGEIAVGTVYLKKGEHVMKASITEGRMDVDAFRFVTSSVRGVAPSELIAKEKTEEEETQLRKIYKNLYVKQGAKGGDGSEISPFGTIEEVQMAVRALRDSMDGDIVINIAPGEYELEKRLEFSNEDGGKDGYKVVYKGSNLLDPPIISGGTHVTNWEKFENGLWRATVENVNDVRQLYINGYPAQRARSKYQYQGSANYDDPNNEYPMDGQYISKINFPKMSNPEDVELVFNILWTSQRVELADILDAGKQYILVYDQPYYEYARTKDYVSSTPWVGNKFYLENAYELTDEPGEFYFDKKTKEIFYYPYPEEDMTTAEAVVGRMEFMLFASGKSGSNKLRDLTFENLDFRYGTWLDINRTGMIVFQDNALLPEESNAVGLGYKAKMLPGQLNFANAKNIIFKNCNFQNLGSTAILMEDNVDNSQIVGCMFRDMSASAIALGDWKYNADYYGNTDDPSILCENNTIANNVVRRTGLEFYGSCGISVYYARNTKIVNNDIKDTSYSGMNVGWGWGSPIPKLMDASGQTVSNNRIVRNSLVVRDGGQIYTMGEMPGTIIEGNYLEESGDYGGVYFDAGSQYLKVTNNVMKDCYNWIFSGARNEKIDFNTVVHNYSTSPNNESWTIEKIFDPTNVVEEPILVPDANWSEEAQEIIKNAGLKQGYQRLLGNAELPEWRKLEFEHVPASTYESTNIMERYAVEYMEGGEGVAYHEASGGKPQQFWQGYVQVVGDTYPGEWLAFDMDFEHGGLYDLELCYALAFNSTETDESENDTGIAPRAAVYIDGEKVLESEPLASTGSWMSHIPTMIGQIEVTPGKHIVKIEFVNNAFSFEKFRLLNADMTESEPDYDDGIEQRKN